jgi:hypothetical protein
VFGKANGRFTRNWIGKKSTHNQIIQAITVDIACTGDWTTTIAGKSYVVFGKANSSAIDLSTIADVSNPTGHYDHLPPRHW